MPAFAGPSRAQQAPAQTPPQAPAQAAAADARKPAALGDVPRGNQLRRSPRHRDRRERARSSRTSTQADFEIYEDGRLQSPTVFSMVDLAIERPFTPRECRRTDRAGRSRDDAHVRRPHLHLPARRSAHLRDADEQRPRARQAIHRPVPRRRRSRRGRVYERPAGVGAGADQQSAAPEGRGRSVSGSEASVGRSREAGDPSAGVGQRNRIPIPATSAPGRTVEGLQRAQSVRDPVRRAACVQRAPVVRRHRERVAVAGGRAGPPQGAAVLQRRLRLRHLPAVLHQSPERPDHHRGARGGGCGAARERQRLRHRSRAA